ncbi:hypothetical protein [Ferrimicrobium sp.]|uniref:YncE family protein n=1 Tax=Ferrimicrobium sp. TaxID=2926050 RepID=UPI00262FFDF8|nr:hypothetical protein [Ferrimicrobium sp.]
MDTNPIVVAVDPTTDTVYVDGTHSVVAINGSTDKVVRTIHGNFFGGGIAVDPTTDTVYVTSYHPTTHYVTNYGGSSPVKTVPSALFTINGSTDKMARTILPSSDGTGIAVDPTTDTVYVDGTHSVVAINGSTDRVTRTIVPSDGAGIAVDPNTDTAYLTSADGLSIVLPPGSRGNSNGSSDRLWFAAGVVVIAVSGGAFMIGMKRRGTVRSA